MSVDEGFLEHLVELFEPTVVCKYKRMFGGAALMTRNGMIAIVMNGQLYLKTDDENRPAFVKAGGEPFVFSAAKRGRDITLSFYTPPEDAMESPDAMEPWARLSLETLSRKAAKKKPVATKKKAPRPSRTAKPAAPRSAPARSR